MVHLGAFTWRAALHRLITYPVLTPLGIAFALTKDCRFLDKFYSVRSLPHGVPLRSGLRLARYEGNWLLFPSREDPNLDDVFLRNVYYPFEPKPDDTVVDVGAHMGFFTVKVAKHVKRVIAFEPDSHSFSFLAQNIKINELSNVSVFNYALGREKAELFLKRSYGDGRTKLTENNTGWAVRVVPLDLVVEEEGITPSVIKIDTEGYEMRVLEGARSTIARHKPQLIIAAYHYPNEAEEVMRYLGRIGIQSSTYHVSLVLQKSKETYVLSNRNLHTKSR